MAKRIAVVGTGYVGLIQAVGLADFGNYVTAVDVRKEIVEDLSSGRPTIFEHGLAEYLERTTKAERLSFTTDAESAVAGADVVFVAVGTPENPDGSADLSQIDAVVDMVARAARGFTVLVIKSTVPVGTNRLVHDALMSTPGRTAGAEFVVVSNPEFLREGKAVHDFFHPDRVVLGFAEPESPEAQEARSVLMDVYRPLNLISVPFVWTNLETAELIKYASNAFLATKITFINQMANLSEAAGADIHTISRTMGMDGRISAKFLHPGPGYGGSCFPKDTKALVSTGDRYNVDMSLIRSVVDGNDQQKTLTADKVLRLLGDETTGRTVGILGLTFKAETDDVRESPAIAVASQLIDAGCRVQVHDPKGQPGFRAHLGDRVIYCGTEVAAAKDADCLLVLTEWNAYRNLDFPRITQAMRGKVVVDARNIMDPDQAIAAGLKYFGTGR